MRIETASGYTILADDADYELLFGYTWNAKRAMGRLYAQAHVRGSGRPYKHITMHRLLMQPPSHLVVHHKNNDGLDNRRCNLQVTTQRVNIWHAHNMGGVSFHKQGGTWRAMGRDETGRRVSLGLHASEERARAVVQNWNYRKMLELEAAGSPEARGLAEVIAKNLAAAQSVHD